MAVSYVALSSTLVAAFLFVTFAAFLVLPKHTVTRRYCRNLWIAIDQLVNALLFGNPRETISSRCARRIARRNCRLCQLLCRALHAVDPAHCEKSLTQPPHPDDVLTG